MQLYTLILSRPMLVSLQSCCVFIKVRCGCRFSQFSMFLIRKLVDSTRKCYPIFPSQYLLVDIIVSSLKLVFRVNKGKKPFIFFQPCIENNSYVYNFFQRPEDYFSSVQKALSILFTQLLVVTELLARTISNSLEVTAGAQLRLSETAFLLCSEPMFWVPLLLHLEVHYLLHQSGPLNSTMWV